MSNTREEKNAKKEPRRSQTSNQKHKLITTSKKHKFIIYGVVVALT